ncbi:MAG: phytoene desaturase family protein [Anaerolineae bacterium]
MVDSLDIRWHSVAYLVLLSAFAHKVGGGAMKARSRVVVVGAGVGGLTTAGLLAQAGYDVTVLEAQTYPGGSASTFFHKGYRFESGATVAGGFQENGPHAVLGAMLDIDWPVHLHDPAWVVHLPDRSVALTQDNADVLEKFPHTERFWDEQSKIADIAWSLSAQGLPWPPRDLAELWQLATVGVLNLPRDLQVLPFALSTVADWLKRHGLQDDQAFRRFIDATLLISAQNTSEVVNGVYGATAMDLARQGVYHVEGGIGGIAETLVDKVRELGGRVLYRQHVQRIEVQNGQAIGVHATRGRRHPETTFFPADFVVVNNTPWSLDQMLGEDSPRSLQRELQRRDNTQGAFVLHLGVDASQLPQGIADHHQIVNSYEGVMGEAETLYVSMSPAWDTSRAPDGKRAVTVSTHTQVQQWWDMLAEDEQAYYDCKQVYAERMIEGIDRVLPGFKNAVELVLPGSPVTYEFYTMRHKGMVGGFPQSSLLRARGPRTGIANIRLVGDSVFPGQSTAGVTLGGIRVAKDVMRHLPTQRTRYTLKMKGQSAE